MTTGRINQVTTLRPRGPSRPQRGRRADYQGRRNESATTNTVQTSPSDRPAMIRHSFISPQATPTRPRPRGSGRVGGLPRELNQMETEPHIRDGFSNDSADCWPEAIDPPDTFSSERGTLQIDSESQIRRGQ